jgi:hypothetical protein
VGRGWRAPLATPYPRSIGLTPANGRQDALGDQWNVLVPILRAQAAGPLIEVGDALAAQPGSEGLVLGLVEVPRGGAGRLTSTVRERQHDLLRWIAASDRPAREPAPRLGVLVRVTHQVALGVREAIYENDSDTVVMEWPGPGSRRPRALGAVLRDLAVDPPANLLLVRPGVAVERARHRVLVPVRGGANAALAVRIGAAVAEYWDGALTVLHVASSADHPLRVDHERSLVERVLEDAGQPSATVHERRSDDVGGTILEEAASHGTVILGSVAERRTPSLVATRLSGMVRALPGTVILVRTVASMGAGALARV